MLTGEWRQCRLLRGEPTTKEGGSRGVGLLARGCYAELVFRKLDLRLGLE